MLGFRVITLGHEDCPTKHLLTKTPASGNDFLRSCKELLKVLITVLDFSLRLNFSWEAFLVLNE